MAVRFNRASIKQKLVQGFSKSKQAETLAYNSLKRTFDKEKRIMLGNFNQHPVTQEIDGGPNAANISKTLGNYGNLFSFIGFDAGSNPTEVIYDKLNQETILHRMARQKRVRQKFVEFVFTFQTPSLEDIYKKTPFPDGWSPGSWVRGIEEGISGLRYYLFRIINKFSFTRSGTAIQVRSPINSVNYKPIKYMSEVLGNFIKKFRTK